MANISRHETAQLLEKFKSKYLPADKLTAAELHVLSQGVRDITRELSNGTGPSTPLLRNYARVLKHFLEAARGDDAIHYFNHIVRQVMRGFDPTTAIKRCRSTVDIEAVKREYKAAVRDWGKSVEVGSSSGQNQRDRFPSSAPASAGA